MPRSRMSRAAHLVERLVRVGPATWWRLLEAQGELLSARRKVRSQGKGFRVERREPMVANGASPSDAVRVGREVALDVARVAAYGVIRPTCLENSLATVAMLRRRGITAAQVRVGVRKHAGTFGAHAWVELDGEVVGDDPHVIAAYVPLDEIAIENLK